MSPPSVVAASEVATMLGMSRQRVTQLTADPDFPLPIEILAVGKIWSYEDVRAWAERHGRPVHPLESRRPAPRS